MYYHWRNKYSYQSEWWCVGLLAALKLFPSDLYGLLHSMLGFRKKKNVSSFSLILLFVLNSSLVESQVQITPNSITQNNGMLSGLFEITLNNLLPVETTIELKINISDDKSQEIVQIGSKRFGLGTGQTVLTQEFQSNCGFNFNTTTVSGEYLAQKRFFMPGTYKVCYSVINVSDGYEIGNYCQEFQIEKGNTVVNDVSEKKKKEIISFHGSSELLFNYSNIQSNYTSVPPTYLNWVFNPQLTIMDIPISGRLFLTTMQSQGQQNMNSFTVQFDANQFRQILKSKLLDFISKNKTLSKVGAVDFSSYLEELSSINSLLQNENVMNEINQLSELDSLNQVVSSASTLKNKVQQVYNNGKNTVGDIKSRFNSGHDSIAVSDTVSHIDSAYHHSLNTVNRLSNRLNDTIGSIQDSLMKVQDSLKRLGDYIYNKYDSAENRINSIVDNPGQLSEIAMDSLKNRIKQLEWLESKREYYDKMIDRKNKIEKYAKKFGLIDSSGNITANNLNSNIDMNQLSNPEYVFDKLKSNKLLRKVDRLLYSVKSFSIGMSTPSFSSLTLNGMAVNGFTIELEPYDVYAGFTYGEIVNPVYTNNLNYASYRRNIISGSFGYGKKEKSHLHITLLSSTDDTTSINPRDSLYLYSKLPQDNKVLSIEGQVKLFKDKWTISGELSGSQTIKDITIYAANNIINTQENVSSSDWFVNILTQRKNVNKAVVDYAIFAKSEVKLFKDKTTLSVSFKRIGPDYYSFGLPYLVRDMMTFEFKASQKLWKNRLALTGFIRRNNDNLTGMKPLTTTFYTYGFDFSLRIPKWPALNASLTPLNLQNDSTVYNLLCFNANANYSFRIKKLQNVLSVTYLKQVSFNNDSTYSFDVNSINLVYSVNIKKGPNIQFNAGYFDSRNVMKTNTTGIIGIGAGMTVLKIWSNSVGGNLYISNLELKWGAYYQTNINILKYLTFSFRIETNQFNTYINTIPGLSDYSQLNCRTLLTAKW